MLKHLHFKSLFLLLCLLVGNSSAWADDYELYSGSLTEGDYLIVYDGKAMTNTVSSDRFGNTTVTITDNKVSNPSASIIWHIAASGDYWTVYNANLKKFAASTGAKNKAQLLSSGTDDKSLWSVTGSSTYEFVNKQNTTNKVNANLRRNGDNGWACYATATGGALSLYKKVETTGEVTTVTINSTGITNTNVFLGTAAGTLTATVTYGSPSVDVSGASVTWSSSNTSVATVGESTGVITLVGEGSTTITASYAGKIGEYKSSYAEYVLNVTYEDPDAVILWSENFSSYNADDVPSGGTYSYTCDNGGGTTKIYDEKMANGEKPELLVAKSSGYFQAVIPLENVEGFMKLKFKKYNNALTVSTSTKGISISGVSSFTEAGECTVTFTGVTTSMTSITIKFTAGSSNVRIDDIELKGTQVALTQVATPVITPASGAIASGTEISISCTTEGSSIYYTTDGSTPTASSTEYNPASKPTITAATTIKAIAVKDGLTDSEMATASYNIAEPCATPTFSVLEGEVTKDTKVTISTETSEATIYYTTNGSTPTTSSSVYSSAITINSDMTIKAIAVKEGLADSEVASATYTVIDYTTLPFTWKGGSSSSLANLTGVTTNGLGSDYGSTNAPYLVKMDGENDYIQIKTNVKPVKVFIGVKMVGGATTSKIKVQESADGSIFTDVEEFVISGKQNDILNFGTSNTFATTTRYIKIIKSVHGSNIGVGPITITNFETFPVSISGAGYKTFCSAYPLKFTGSSIKAYIASASAKTVTFTEVESVPANTGILLKGSEGDYDIAIEANSTDVSSNVLVGVTAATEMPAGIFVLMNGTSGVGFYKTTKAFTVGANTAYLPAEVAAGRMFIGFNDEEEVTGINEVKTLKNYDAIYDLRGMRVTTPKKGLYIKGGKKIVFK